MGEQGVNPAAHTPLDRLMARPAALDRFQPEASRHVVRSGDTLGEIAARAGTTWQVLARINGLTNPDLIHPGQVLRLPSSSVSVHVVRGGDTLSAIARANGTTVAALARTNGIADPDRIQIGQRILLDGAAAAPATASRSSARTGEAAPAAPATDAARMTGVPAPDAASVRSAEIAADRARGRQSQGRCYAWVKDALLAGGAVSSRPPGVPAKEAGTELARRGFVNALEIPGNGIRSAYDAPVGAVLVYGAAPGATDRNARYGHIEIRTREGFASDYASARARTGDAANGLEGRGRVLIGVWIRPAAGAQPAQPTAPAQAVAPGGGTQVTADQLRAIMPNAGDAADRFVGPINEAMAARGITTPARQAAFLAQISVESGQLRGTVENLNYSARRMTEVWPRRFPTIASAEPFARNPEALGNRVYADRLGNGDAASGDGYRYRGRGLMQVTGRENYRAVGFENNPEALAEPRVAADTAAAFWSDNGLNARTDAVLGRAAFNEVSRTINGGDNGSAERWAAYQRAIETLNVR